ncbi:hypothetical protein ACO3UB_08410 (plasmid) [Methanocaldococcus sp. 16A]
MDYKSAINRLRNEFGINLDDPAISDEDVRSILWDMRVTRSVRKILMWAFRKYREERGLPVC